MNPKNENNPFGAPAADDNDFSLEHLPSEQEEGDKWRVPQADYPATCIGLEKGTSNAGNPMWVWEFKLDGPKEYRGRSFKTFTALTPAALWKLREVVVALGLGDGGGKLKFKKTDAVGKKCTLTIEDDTWDGKIISTIMRVTPAQKGSPASAAVDDGIPF